METIINEAKNKMAQSVEVLKKEYATMRTSRATPALLSRIMVSQYGQEVPLQHVASVSAPDPKSLVIQPWDKTVLSDIEKAIQKSDLGLNPQNDGNLIRLPIPPLTEERRNDLVKNAKKKAEEFKVALRNVRRDANEDLKAREKKSEVTQDECKKGLDRIQKLTDEHIDLIDKTFKAKENEILGK
ncbi:MAG TPA: ribosome recycling factor [Candidatus Riflebacteria bacterium]|nr:MAG: ribosome recycling factor [Candidatus Riflebacteria bacterium HGW-Riflebacteria-1]HAE38822.1 ribosome recycling factor [Candidatus Riflebacteria bacterium]